VDNGRALQASQGRSANPFFIGTRLAELHRYSEVPQRDVSSITDMDMLEEASPVKT
jgi:hypothetical protein